MAFKRNDLTSVAEEIENRRVTAERLALVEITSDEREVIRDIVKKSIYSRTTGEKVGLLILLFAFDLLEPVAISAPKIGQANKNLLH